MDNQENADRSNSSGALDLAKAAQEKPLNQVAEEAYNNLVDGFGLREVEKAAQDGLKDLGQAVGEAAKPRPLNEVAGSSFDALVKELGLENALKVVEEMARKAAEAAKPRPLSKVIEDTVKKATD